MNPRYPFSSLPPKIPLNLTNQPIISHIELSIGAPLLQDASSVLGVVGAFVS